MKAWRRWALNSQSYLEAAPFGPCAVPLLGTRAGEFHLGVTEELALGRAVALEPGAHRAFEDAMSAVGHLLPATLDSDVALGFRRVAESALDLDARSAATMLRYDGASFGGALGLAVLARRLGRGIDDTVYISATVDSDGKLGPVEGMESKVAGLASLTAGGPVVTLIVAAEQAVLADGLAEVNPGVELVPARTLAAAAEIAFGASDFDELLLGRIAPHEREAMAMRWFRDVVGRRSLGQWPALRRFLSRAAIEWELPRQGRCALALARDIAWRNEANGRGADLSFEDVRWFLSSLPMGLRLKCKSQLIQQSTDTDAWPVDWVEHIVEQYRGSSARDLHGDELELAGAVGRWMGTGGFAEDACQLALELAEVHVEVEDYSELSRPLSEAFRLAGVTGDVARWDRCVMLARRAQRSDLVTRSWTALSAARGAWWLGRLQDARDWLDSIPATQIANKRLGAELRALILRFRVHCGLAESTSLSEGWFDDAVGARDAEIARLLYLIERLDDPPVVDSAIESLRALEPGLVRRLERAWTGRRTVMPLAEWIARFYPY